MKTYRMEWRWGLAAASAIMVIAMLPQVLFLADRGPDWRGANAAMHPDEVAYSAYTAALIRNRARRNDPYTGREDRPEHPIAESLFSIQIVPAYVIVAPARWLGLTAANVFMVFPILCAAISSLAIFWFITLLTHDKWLGAAAVWIVLSLGTLFARQGIIRHIPNLPYLIPQWLSDMVGPASVYHLPFLRFYQPAIAFPLFFVLGALTWLALTEPTNRKAVIAALGAGATFTLMVFSYFYLWTAAAAWLICICGLWLSARKSERERVLVVFGIVGAFALSTLITYFWMLSHRATTVDTTQALVTTHLPDLFRLSEVAALIVLFLLLLGVRRRIFESRDGVVLFTASLALAVLVVFNQQVITGRSLQPIHYEWFIANYCALVALVLTASLWRRNQARTLLTNKRLAIVAVTALLWGGGEAWLAASLNLNYNRQVDEVLPVAKVLTALANTDGTTQAQRSGGAIPVVLMADLALADRLPTDAPQSVLWAPRMLVFPAVAESENRERFFQQLYYLGFDEKKFYKELDRRDWNLYAGLFPYSRVSPMVNGNISPISAEEIRMQVRNYLRFAGAFSRESAASPVLSYLVLSAENEPDYSNLDRWYQRDAGVRIGRFVIYRLKLRD
jgi:hypothetical protein